jgi:hypothetical protein
LIDWLEATDEALAEEKVQEAEALKRRRGYSGGCLAVPSTSCTQVPLW